MLYSKPCDKYVMFNIKLMLKIILSVKYNLGLSIDLYIPLIANKLEIILTINRGRVNLFCSVKNVSISDMI